MFLTCFNISLHIFRALVTLQGCDGTRNKLDLFSWFYKVKDDGEASVKGKDINDNCNNRKVHQRFVLTGVVL